SLLKSPGLRLLAASSHRAYHVLTGSIVPVITRESMTSISKRTVDAVKAAARDTYLWDRELKGFGLKVTPAARKVYLVQYRLGGRKGRTRRGTIGVHGTLTADEARTRAKQLLGEVAAGRGPAAK